jgi:DNA-binding LacI/PurR family transcriptional regulator
MKNIINVIAEKSYMDTTWFKRIFSGIENQINPRKEKINVINLTDINTLISGSVLIIIGFSGKFISDAVNSCLENNIRPLLVASNSNTVESDNISCITVNRENIMFQNVTTLFNNGYKRIAMIGVNPQVYTDVAHMQGYRLAVLNHGFVNYKDDIYYNTIGIDDAINRFMQNQQKYDAVVCTNDYVAVLLLEHLHKAGIKVPEQLSITGAGNLEVSKFTNPPLTTIDIPLDEAGKQAVVLYRTLRAHPAITSLYSTFKLSIIYRDSTIVNKVTKQAELYFNNSYSSVLEPDYEKSMRPIWSFANAHALMDDIDKHILYGIIHNLSNSEIADSIYISDSTLQYRLNKLYEQTGISGKKEIREFMIKYFPNYTY